MIKKHILLWVAFLFAQANTITISSIHAKTYNGRWHIVDAPSKSWKEQSGLDAYYWKQKFGIDLDQIEFLVFYLINLFIAIILTLIIISISILIIYCVCAMALLIAFALWAIVQHMLSLIRSGDRQE